MTAMRTHTHTFTTHSLVKPLVRSIIEHPFDHEWSLQGFGMLRTYLDSKDLRLHIWDSRFKVADVSELHTHPWNFHSYVVSGEVKNRRYTKNPADSILIGIAEAGVYREQEILCGEGGHETDRSREVALVPGRLERVFENDHYSQLAHEIHRSEPVDGTVTIIAREFLDDDDHAFVYVPQDQEWVSAEPRPATREEVGEICAKAFELMR